MGWVVNEIYHVIYPLDLTFITAFRMEGTKLFHVEKFT